LILTLAQIPRVLPITLQLLRCSSNEPILYTCTARLSNRPGSTKNRRARCLRRRGQRLLPPQFALAFRPLQLFDLFATGERDPLLLYSAILAHIASVVKSEPRQSHE
jgi:hypothetical protein